MERQRPRVVAAASFALVAVAAVLIQVSRADSPDHGASDRPAPPRAAVAVDEMPAVTRAVTVHAGGNLQRAIDQAVPGEAIELDPGAVYRGPFRLPAKTGSGWIVVESTAQGGALPSPGSRVSPDDAPAMPKLEAAKGPVVASRPRAGHYRFVGIEIRPVRRLESPLTNLIELGGGARKPGELPHHIVFDRCYIHGDPRLGARRAIAMNARFAAVIDSYIADIKSAGVDSQAVAAWNGPGPFMIENNYIEAAGENVMFGGADPASARMIPSDIEIRGNHFTKSRRWQKDKGGAKRRHWSVKNLFEIKDAKRVRIEGNLFEYNWADAQNGFAILFTVRDQQGTAPFSTIRDITFSNNVVRHVASGINILGLDDNHPSQETARVLISNNLFEDVGYSWGDGTLFQLVDGGDAVHIEHNTALQSGSIVVSSVGHPHTRFIFSANVVKNNRYGIIGTGTSSGLGTLKRYFPQAVVRSNVIIGGDDRDYPAGNYFPKSVEHAHLVSANDRVLRRIVSGPAGKRKPDGAVSAGVNAYALCRALATGGSHLPSIVRVCSGH